MKKPIEMAGLSWFFQAVIAVILLQTLYFKFTGAEESVFIFKTLGMEPWGRLGTGIAELIASVLLFVPSLVVYGAIMTVGLMSGAILGHLTELGVEVQGDGGYLFSLAVICLVSSLLILWIRRKQLADLLQLLFSHSRLT